MYIYIYIYIYICMYIYTYIVYTAFINSLLSTTNFSLMIHFKKEFTSYNLHNLHQ